MRNVIITAVMMLLSSGIAFSESALYPDSADHRSYKHVLKVTAGQKQILKDVFLVGADNTKLKRVVYIFHGYKPDNDPYKQSPLYFIANWKLADMAKSHGILFVLPDNGTSVYPITKIDDPFSDLAILNVMKKEIDARYKTSQAPLSIGFSAGVEGIIKFSVLNDIHEIVAISGNYDLRYLPDNERKFYQQYMGSTKEFFELESPVVILKGSSKIIYLFCEENNAVNVMQAQHLFDAAIPGIKLIDFRSLGKGYKHDWAFLVSPGIIQNLEKIISNNVSVDVAK